MDMAKFTGNYCLKKTFNNYLSIPTIEMLTEWNYLPIMLRTPIRVMIIQRQGCVVIQRQGCVVIQRQGYVVIQRQGCVVKQCRGCVVKQRQGCVVKQRQD